MRAFCLASSLALLLAGISLAAASPTVEKPVKAEPGVPPVANASTSPQSFVHSAAIGDTYEIESGKLAEAKGQTQAIKNFARQMVEAHSRTSAQLDAALKKGNLAIVPTRGLNAAHRKLLHDLKAANAGDFDRLYLTQQATAHQDALTLMHTYVVSGDNAALKTFAKSDIPVIRRHIKEIVKLKVQAG